MPDGQTTEFGRHSMLEIRRPMPACAVCDALSVRPRCVCLVLLRECRQVSSRRDALLDIVFGLPFLPAPCSCDPSGLQRSREISDRRLIEVQVGCQQSRHFQARFPRQVGCTRQRIVLMYCSNTSYVSIKPHLCMVHVSVSERQCSLTGIGETRKYPSRYGYCLDGLGS